MKIRRQSLQSDLLRVKNGTTSLAEYKEESLQHALHRNMKIHVGISQKSPFPLCHLTPLGIETLIYQKGLGLGNEVHFAQGSFFLPGHVFHWNQ